MKDLSLRETDGLIGGTNSPGICKAEISASHSLADVTTKPLLRLGSTSCKSFAWHLDERARISRYFEAQFANTSPLVADAHSFARTQPTSAV